MASNSVIYPPNRPLERILAPSKTPVPCNYLFFIDINANGDVLVGSSNVSGSFWDGTLYHYKDCAAATSDNYSGYYIGPSTFADAKFVKNRNKIVAADDNGSLSLLSFAEAGDPPITCETACKTNGRVEQLAMWNDNQRVLACFDTSVMLWDIQNIASNSLQEFKDYHTEVVTSVDANRNEPNIFASASIDKRACIWDDRMEVPATMLYQNQFSGLTSISWNPKQSEYLVVGSEGGDVYQLDTRQPKEFTASNSCFDAKVHRVVLNDAGFLAVCGDTSEVLILSTSDNLKVIYESTGHSAYVRGLAWFEETLYSCGFDRKILKHVY